MSPCHPSRLATLALLFALLLGMPPTLPAQNMANTVVTHALSFARGTNGTEVSGRAGYGMSYVYTVRVRAGQTMTASVHSRGGAVTFSVVAPAAGALPDAFGVTEWSGALEETGEYRLVLVMNDAQLKPVAYRLKVTVR